MWGYLVSGKGKIEHRQIQGLWVLYAPVSRLRPWCWRKLRGIRTAIVPQELWKEALRHGIRPVPVYPLRRALLEQMLDLYPGQCAHLSATHVTKDVESAALTLARKYRYVTLDTGVGTEGLRQLLLKRCGLGDGSVGVPVVTVSFDGEEKGPVIYLGEDCQTRQVAEYGPLCGQLLPEQLLSALYQAEKVKKEEITLKTLRPKCLTE